MKKTALKIISVLLCAVIFLGSTFTAGAATLTATQFSKKLEEVKAKYPEGSQQYEWKVNGAVVGWQCHGYARWISSYIWGTDFANGEGEGWVRYNSTATTTHIDKLVPGDVLRYRTAANKSSNHSIFVTSIVGDTVYFTDCNSDGKNTIKWERSMTKAKLVEHLKMRLADRDYVEYGYIAHYTPNTLSVNGRLYLKYNANGGRVNLPTTKITQYTVADSKGINMRSGPGTTYGVVTALPKGTVFTVTETAVGNGYTWGKTTYNGINGWCVISREWTTKTETTIPPAYYLHTNGDVYITASKQAFNESLTFGATASGGLANPDKFGLVKDNCTFLGWSKTADGSDILKQGTAFMPEALFPEANGKDYSATLYAVWQSNKVLTGIEVASLPTKTKYLLNAPFNSAGLKIKLLYSNNTSEIITTGFELNGFDSATEGEKTITVSYKEMKTSFKVLVENLKTGDINNDLNIDLIDINLLAQYVAEWNIDCNTEALDTNADGFITLTDIVHLSQYVAGWENIILH